MTNYDVTYLIPSYGVFTSREKNLNRLSEVNGEILYKHNDLYTSCKVLGCKPITVQPITREMVTMNGRFGCE
jgi:hypothetical protein